MSPSPFFLPVEVDRLLRYPPGRAEELARQGKLPHTLLPCGEVRFAKAVIEKIIKGSETRRWEVPCDN